MMINDRVTGVCVYYTVLIILERTFSSYKKVCCETCVALRRQQPHIARVYRV